MQSEDSEIEPDGGVAVTTAVGIDDSACVVPPEGSDRGGPVAVAENSEAGPQADQAPSHGARSSPTELEDPRAPQILAACRAMFPTLEILTLRHLLPGIISCTARFPGADEASTFQVQVLDPAATSHRDEAEFEALPAATSDARLVRLREFAIVHGHPCFSVDHREGVSLRSLMMDDALTPRRVLAIVGGVCDLLESLHAAGIRHFCPAPEFVFVGSEDAPFIELAGMIPLVSGSASERQRFAAQLPARHRAYLAPEYCEVDGAPDHRADQFSIGVLLYELLMGRPPSGFFSLPSARAGLSCRIDSIIATCLQGDPELRFPSAAALRDELARVGEADDSSCDARLPDLPETGGDADRTDWKETNKVSRGRTWVKVAGALAVAAIIGTATYVYLTRAFPNTGLLPALSSVEAVLAQARRAVDEGRYEEAVQLVRQALGKSDGEPTILSPAMDILERTGHYANALAVVDEKIASMPGSAAHLAALKAAREEFAQRVAAYDNAMTSAERAVDATDDAAERAALQEALRIMPLDREAASRMQANPIAIRAGIEEALSRIARAQPGFDVADASFIVRRGGADLDLSGCAAVSDLAPLRGLPIEALDVSGTSVSSLAAMSGAPLRRLWCDDTPLATLGGIGSLPLETLTFERSAVADASIAEGIGTLRTLRHSVGGGPVHRLPPPERGREWENSLGMRFAPVEGTRLLASVWETRVIDWANYLEDMGLGGTVAVHVVDQNGDSQERQVDWQDPTVAPGRRFAARGMTAHEAEDFCAWLTRRESAAGILSTGMRYRLPTDEEWSAMAGLDPWPLHTPIARATLGRPVMPWPEGTWPPPSPPSEQDDLAVSRGIARNGFRGLGANVVEWTASTPSPEALAYRVARGSALHGILPSDLTSALLDLRLRQAIPEKRRTTTVGFRVVLDLDTSAPSPHAPSDPATAIVQAIQARDWATVRATAEELAKSAPPGPEQDAAQSALEICALAESFRERRRLPVAMERTIPTRGAHRYLLCRIPLDWESAKAAALAVGGHLVTITAPEEMAFLEETFFDAPIPFGVWIGAEARDTNSGPVWYWQGGGSANLPSQPPPSSAAKLLVAPAFEPVESTPSSRWPATLEWVPVGGDQRLWFIIEWG